MFGEPVRLQKSKPQGALHARISTAVSAPCSRDMPRSIDSKKARDRIENIFNSVRSGETEHFFYLPNSCVAEVFSVFMKHSFGAWNRHLPMKPRVSSVPVSFAFRPFSTKAYVFRGWRYRSCFVSGISCDTKLSKPGCVLSTVPRQPPGAAKRMLFLFDLIGDGDHPGFERGVYFL